MMNKGAYQKIEETDYEVLYDLKDLLDLYMKQQKAIFGRNTKYLTDLKKLLETELEEVTTILFGD